jgi:tRNA modification GTPase
MSALFNADTVFAQATPPGKSGVAVIRLSGPAVKAALKAVGFVGEPQARYAHYHAFRHGEELIDQGLILYFPTPHSFTGEDVAEFQLHGGVAILRRMLSLLSTLPGLRLAEPGEFARRAFLNGKMDLTAAEGLVDLIDAETEAQRHQAMQLVRGESAQFYQRLREQIIRPLAFLEAYIDFPDEEIPPSAQSEIDATVDALRTEMDALLAESRFAERLREGFTVVLLGAPNAGKSSLLNALARRDVAIVSDMAGTTRDSLEVHLDIDGLPVVMIDTAGLREATDAIESEGIRRSLERAEHADLKCFCLAPGDVPSSIAIAQMDAQTILVHTKSDIADSLKDKTGVLGNGGLHQPIAEVALSVQSGNGVDSLLHEIKAALEDKMPKASSRAITHQRHRHHVARASECLRQYRDNAMAPIEIRCEYLRLAAVECARITGHIDVEDLLDVIFSSFCIGK